MASKFHNYGPTGSAIADGDYAAASRQIVAALAAASGNQTAAAAAMKVSDRTMRRWISTLAGAGFDVRKEATAAAEAKKKKPVAKKKRAA